MLTWHECSESYFENHYSHVICQARNFLSQKNSAHVICFRYQKYHAYFFAIGLCGARPPKHMSSWHAISSPSEKTQKTYEKHWFALWHLSFTWYSPVCHVITHMVVHQQYTNKMHTCKAMLKWWSRWRNLMTSTDRIKKIGGADWTPSPSPSSRPLHGGSFSAIFLFDGF